MDIYDEYFKIINKIGKYAFMHNIECEADFISKILKSNYENKKEIFSAVELRRQLGLLQEDIGCLHVYLDAGSQILVDFEDKEAAFCVSLDITKAVRKNELIFECKKYDIDNDKLFIEYPKLKNIVDEKKELMNISEAKHYKNSRALNFMSAKIKVSNRLNPNILPYLKLNYPQNKILARIDNKYFGKNFSEPCNEDIIRSEKSGWYKNTLIYNNEKKLGAYEFNLYDLRLGLSKNEIKKSDLNGIPREGNKCQLQTHFKRDNSGLLSGSIEEFEVAKNNNILVSKYLHLTSTAPQKTEWKNVDLAHIDGAINIYFDDNVKKRILNHLDTKVQADCRTHLFRIENIPITEVLPISKMFFYEALVEEWEEDSFTF